MIVRSYAGYAGYAGFGAMKIVKQTDGDAIYLVGKKGKYHFVDMATVAAYQAKLGAGWALAPATSLNAVPDVETPDEVETGPRLLGLPPMVVYAGGGAVVLGGLAFAFLKLRKKGRGR